MGFAAFPAGNQNSGSFNNLGSNANFWTATENSSSNAYNRNFNTGASMNSNNNNKSNGYSVRLVKDSSEGTLSVPSLYRLLYKSYRLARKNKRNTRSQLKFELDLESNLLRLAQELYSRTYELSPSVCFINELPVKREVVAADFRDRVVHHLLCSWLFPIFERQFIFDSYSCRKGKGTLFGINRARGFLRAASNDFHGDCWVLKLDVKGFFMNINKDLLYGFIMDGLERAKWSDVPDIDLCKYLIKKIVYAKPLDTAIFRSPPEAWDDLPHDKSMKYAGDERGLPIGNLTSQLFGNIYMNKLDHFVKRKLKIRYYGRYVDDMVLVSDDKERLVDAIDRIRKFLKKELLLTLHPHKIQLQPAAFGFDFLGVHILPYRVYPGTMVLKNCKKAVVNPDNDHAKQESRINSYEGMFKHLNGTSKIRKFIADSRKPP